MFVTNNSTKSRADYKKKFDVMGIPCEVVRLHQHSRRSFTEFSPSVLA